MALLAKSAEFLATTSTLVQRAAPEHRSDLASFERESAMAQTAPAMSPTPREVVKAAPPAAELAQTVTITKRGDRYQIDIHGDGGGGVTGILARAELQRIMQMLQEVVVKAGWTGAAAAAMAAPQQPPAPPIRH
jgi:hypothetical protein